MVETKFEAAIGLSRKWDAREAGTEVARIAVKDLSRPPSFFLLFSTIHYDKHGGFEEFLNGVWDVLPEGTPLIGGTVAGFINPQGCYTRGATAMAVSYPNMDVAVGVGKNTKRSPKKAARQCAETIKKGLAGSDYKNSFLIDVLSSGVVPEFPIFGRKKVIRSKFLSKGIISLLKYSETIFQKGIGKQDDILEELVKCMSEYKILSGSATDDISQLKNLQFCNTNISTNSIVGLGIKTNLNFDINTTHGLRKTGQYLQVTKLKHNARIIDRINGKPAILELFKLIGLTEEDLNEQIFRKIFWFPLGLEGKNGEIIPVVAGIFLGHSFLVVFKVPKPIINLLTISGRDMLNAVDNNLEYFKDSQPLMGIIPSCGMRLLAFGHDIYTVRDKLLRFFQDKPFLLYYVAGEATYSPEKKLNYGNYTFNTAIFWENSI